MISKGKIIIYNVLILLLFFGLINIFINATGKIFYLELLGLLVLMLLSLIGFVGINKAWGERVLFFVFLFYLINLALVWSYNGNLYLMLLLLAIIGFLLSSPRCSGSCSCNQELEQGLEEPPHSEVYDVEEKKEPKKKVQHSPGKYVASARSNIYHAPTCEWAKKIKKERQVWFKEKKNAWEKGYKGHSCVK